MSDLALFSANPSRGFMNQWILEELGIAYDLRLLDLDADEHKTAEYLAVNPMGKVPALLHGDRLVTEASAISFYLAEQFPEKGLSIDSKSPLRGSYLRWCFFAPVTFEPSIVSKAFGLTHPDYKPFADIETVAETLRLALSDREFIVGDRFTAADVAIGSAIYWALELMPVLPKHPELVDYWNRLSKRPGWRAAMGSDD